MKKFLFGLALVVVFFIGLACNKRSLASFGSFEADAATIFYEPFVDEKTGVSYLIFRTAYTSEIAVCPRYNADGTLYTGN